VIHVDHHAHPVMETLAHHWHEVYHSAVGMATHAFTTLPFILALLGVLTAWFFYMKRPDIPAAIQQKFNWLHTILEQKYGFDHFNEVFFAGGSRLVGRFLWQVGDVKLIDGAIVNGTAFGIGKLALIVRKLQSGLIYHYAFAMIIGVFVLLTYFYEFF